MNLTIKLAISRFCSPFRAANVRTVPHRIRTPGASSLSSAAAPFENDPTVYKQHKKKRQEALHAKLTSSNRFQPISAREDRSDWPAAMCKAICKGKWLPVYKGCEIVKCPEDLIIRNQLFWYLKPATVIELGAYTGGMAIWMGDTLKTLDIPCQIYSVDVDLSLLEDRVKEVKPDNVTFLQGDCYAIDKTFTPEFMSQLPHPWVVFEDAHENFSNVLGHFHKFMQQGARDYLIVEDTDPRIPREVGMGFYEEPYLEYGTQKLENLKGFLKEYEEYYAVDSFYTDFYGYNGSWFWHGYVKRMK